MFVKLKAILLLTFFTAFSLSESASFANLIQKFITLTKRYLNNMKSLTKYLQDLWKSNSDYNSSYFFSDDLRIELGDPSTITYKPDFDNLTFGHSFSDHMLRIQWSQDRGWHQPVICKLEDLRIHPGAKVSTYIFFQI